MKIIDNAGSIIVDLLHEEKKFRLWVGQGEFRFEKILILQTSIGGGGGGGWRRVLLSFRENYG